MNGVSWRLVDRVARLLDDDDRDAVRGDQAELGASAGMALREVLGLVARRQTALWKDWRPWLTLVGFVLPVGVLLTFVADGLGRAYDLYFWIFRNHADIDSGILSEIGLTIPHGIAFLVTRSLLLACVSWISGFVLGSIARRTVWINGALVGLLLLAAALPLGSQPYQYDVNGGIFSLRFYRAIFPVLRLSLLVILPAFCGIRLGLARILRPSIQALLWIAAIVTALAAPIGFSLPFPRSSPMQLLLLAAYLPVACITAIAISRWREKAVAV